MYVWCTWGKDYLCRKKGKKKKKATGISRLILSVLCLSLTRSDQINSLVPYSQQLLDQINLAKASQRANHPSRQAGSGGSALNQRNGPGVRSRADNRALASSGRLHTYVCVCVYIWYLLFSSGWRALYVCMSCRVFVLQPGRLAWCSPLPVGTLPRPHVLYSFSHPCPHTTPPPPEFISSISFIYVCVKLKHKGHTK